MTFLRASCVDMLCFPQLDTNCEGFSPSFGK
jgi:hypothetical protein